ncbi:DUF4344 domain-containing metallopeptidase [Anaeromyxobacter oryzae]|uniref:DUF4344 domain-containing metallopeptidase n=1 Tax=Anaeromyxobacter oryzae TaxID=2918170 RepID=UPI0020C013A7|nr:DUF4344 domain-containing metallopeptidase [Anaeromyxobacter oryzae]
MPAPPVGPRSALVRIEYDPPKEPAHRPLYEHLRERKVLETFAEVFGVVRLPRPLTVRFAGCDGESNAWYESEDLTVTFCYELVAEFERASAGAAPYGVSRDDAIEGPVVFVLLHEAGHAIFDLLDVPILGREEDAADHLAAYVLLQAGKGIARRILTGAAWMYRHDAASRAPDESDFSDVHGLDAQRHYNVLCMAYGSDAESYRGLVDRGYLPKNRAQGCHDEYEQVAFAMRQLVWASLDAGGAGRTRVLHQPSFDVPRGAAPATRNAAGAPAPGTEGR